MGRRKLAGTDAAAITASLDAFIEQSVEPRLAAAPPPVATDPRSMNLRGVQSVVGQKHFVSRQTLDSAQVLAGAALALPSAWAHQHRCLKGEPLVFRPKVITDRNLHRVRPFLEQPLNDGAKKKGYRKARQIGLSENSVTECTWFCDTKPHSKCFYTFPTNRQMQDFSNTRIAEAIQESPRLQAILGDIKNVNLKKIGSSFLFLRGAQAERLGEGVDADAAWFDEIDRMPPRVQVAFEESLQSSRWGWIREISTPTVPNYGIDVGWNDSKQFYWFIKCSRCGVRQTLEWLPDDQFSGRVSISEKDGVKFYACRACGRELAAEDRWSGEWVARHPSKDASYYQFTQLMAPWISAQRLFDKQEDYPFKQLFYNYCLGVPYLGDNILVTEAMILGCRTMVSKDSWKGPRVLGIDWGDKSWIVGLQALPDDKVGLFHLERILSDDVDEIVAQASNCFRSTKSDLMVCDAGYGKDKNTKLLKMHPDKLFACFYPVIEKGSRIFQPQWQDEQHKVSVDRTTSVKLSLGLFKTGKVVIAREVSPDELRTFAKHLTNLVSAKDYDEKTGEIEEWIVSTGADHYGHGFNYACTALSKLASLPHSECWDWPADLREAKRTGLVDVGSAAPRTSPMVPGFTSIKELVELSGGTRPDKAACYTVSFGKLDACANCTLQRSCKRICDQNAGTET